MNYLKIYISLIRKAQSEIRFKNRFKNNGLWEKHHIFPQSIYGKNNNIVLLSPKEHYIAHMLLWKTCKKRYGEYHYRTYKMFYAFNTMSWSGKNHKRLTSRDFDYHKKYRQLYMMGEGNPAKSTVNRKKISDSKIGKERLDMKGKSYFGSEKSSEEITIKMMKSKKNTIDKNMKLYGRAFESTNVRGPNKEKRRDETNKRSSNSYKDRLESYKELSHNDVLKWLYNKSLYNDKGKLNSNISRLLSIRGEKIDNYYYIEDGNWTLKKM